MQLVIDTSAIIAVIGNEPEKPALIQATTGTELLAPASVPWEVGNAFSAMLKRKRVGPDQAKKALGIFRQIPIRFVDVDLEQAVGLAHKLNIYAYDAYLIAAALEHRCSLLTLDRGLIHAAKSEGVSLVEVER